MSPRRPDPGDMPLTDSDFARVKARVYDAAGISMSDAKRSLVVSRLYKILRARRMRSFAEYLDHLDASAAPEDAQEFVNALTTNLTRFFREEHHFAHLSEHVGTLLRHPPGLGSGDRPRLRIWSAGCSTGQEAYTIALSLLAAHPELRRWDFRVLATDIDTDVIAKASSGIYPVSELKGLSTEQRRLFEDEDAGHIRIPLEARRVVVFKPLNLLGAWPMRGPFDAIFCRNVTIYFDKPTQAELFTRFARILRPGGFLYIGHSENAGAASDTLRLVGKTVYRAAAQDRARSAA